MSESNMTAEASIDALGSAAKLVAKAVASWTGELVDLGGRNTLLYYRDLKQGTLALGPESPENEIALENLLSGRTVRLSHLFGDTARGSAARRARTVKGKADENFQERGLQTLFLAWGMATWENPKSTATPAAPVMLRQVALTPRGGAGEDFDLVLPGEWEINPTMLYMLKTDYEVDLAADDLLALFDEDADPPDAMPVFERLTKAGANVGGFTVIPRVVIGNFSYAKLPMVLDLENSAETLAASDLICALAGDQPSRDAVRARHPQVTLSEPDRIPPRDEFLVLDADASQSYAINAAVGSADLVIDGPPGTGKSQTIANLIATLAARGQRILFVAEKRAAIDAVLDRLNRVGLGELVLDLHEGAGSKRKLAADLSRSLASAATLARPDMADAQENLVKRRGVLVGTTDALHRIRDPWGLSVYDAQSRLLAIPSSANSKERLRGETLGRLDSDRCRIAQQDLEAFVGLGGLAISRQSNPWGGAFMDTTIPTSESAKTALDVVTTLATHTLASASARFAQALSECGLSSPSAMGAWAEILQLFKGVSATLEVFERAIFDLPLAEINTALAPGRKGAIGHLSAMIGNGAYRKARKAALGLWTGAKPSAKEFLAAMDRAGEVASKWRRIATDGGAPRLPSDLIGTAGTYGQLVLELQDLAKWSAHPDILGRSLADASSLVQALSQDTQTLSRLPELSRLNSRLHAVGLASLVTEMRSRNFTVDQALACLEHVWLMSILEAVSMADPLVGAFDGTAHSRTIAEYQRADLYHIEKAALRVRRAVGEHMTQVRDKWPKESDVIEHQARLKRGHLPVRQLFQAAPHVLGALKPCWAMSPLVVAQLLPAQRLFDVVIFDEASQVTPADAVGALMRAERAVVAGDAHQLPPTSFFATSSGGGEDDEALEDEIYSSAGTKNMESILDAMSALLPAPIGTRTLGWHYRSKDERLIAFSNAQAELYDWAMTTFPGVGGDTCLTHELVPFRPRQPAQQESSADEVARVVEIVAEHAARRPGESLGVIAMGIKHANRIDEALRRARIEDPALDEFLAGRASAQAQKELFFVKNLERVQGDERDAIIMTVGYTKTADGRMLYRFGPINNDGGQRRLNVAITRARARMTVVSSFSSADMDPAKLNSEGPKMLGRYLAYAESGGADLGRVSRDKPDLNPFERDIREKLTKAGIPLIAQYGCSGYWIDFAAQHPVRPGQMVMAIECDGATYHSSATARDRDRLRQEHLERLGWRFHRIWSQDWFHHHEVEIVRAVGAYQAAVADLDAGGSGYKVPGGATSKGAHWTTATESTASMQGPTTPISRAGACPVVVGRTNIDAYSQRELVAIVRWIESDTLLRTEEELLAETIGVLGFSRKGVKITNAIRGAIAVARKSPSKPTGRNAQNQGPRPTAVGERLPLQVRVVCPTCKKQSLVTAPNAIDLFSFTCGCGRKFKVRPK